MGIVEHQFFKNPNASMMVCTVQTPFYSRGRMYDDKPWDFAIPLLLMQITLVVTATRVVRCLLKPFNQPRIVSEILGGLIIGRAFLAANNRFDQVVFPSHSKFVLRNLSKIGLVHFMFIIGVKIEFTSVFKTGKRALFISLSGILLPLVVVMLLKSHLENYLPDSKHLPFGSVVATYVSLTNFPVLHPILAEINLLNSDVGKLAMSSSMINDMATWIFSVLANSISTGGINHALGVLNFLCVVGMVMFIVFVFRPAMLWIIRKTPEGRPVEQKYIVAIMLFVFSMAFIGEMLGVTTIIGPLIMGLAIPDGPPLGATIVDKTETLTQELFMPAFYARIGETTTGSGMADFVSWMTLSLIITVGFIAKIIGTLLPSLICKIPFRNALALGLTMNFKGQFELMNFLSNRDKEFMEQRSHNILVFSALLVTAITTPIVRKLCKPVKTSELSARRTILHSHPNTELRIIACTHSEENVAAIINLLQASNATKENPICVYLLHLLELVGRATPMLIAHDKLKRSPNPTATDRIVNAFQKYEERNTGIVIQPFICMSPYITMHEDICAFASEKFTSLIVIPFHKRVTFDGELGAVDNAFRTVNPNILDNAPCSVGVLVDRSQSGSVCLNSELFSYNIGAIFLGGADDREALAYAVRMAQQSGISLNILRILGFDDEWDNTMERRLDDELINAFRSWSMPNYRIGYKEEIVKDVGSMFNAIRSMEGNYHLFIVGRRHESSSLLTKEMMELSENPQLGAIGDMLSSSDFGGVASVLVIQQHTETRRYIHVV